jgi:hypothetical protein
MRSRSTREEPRARRSARAALHRPPRGQALPLIAVVLRRWRAPEGTRLRLLLAAAASHASLFVLLLSEALQGQSVAAPDAGLSRRLRSGPHSARSSSAGLAWARAGRRGTLFEPQFSVAHGGAGQPTLQVFMSVNLQFPLGQ